MDIRLHNSFNRTREVLAPREPGKVSLYVCGPTVYDHPHLGHARVYVVFDTLVRFLRHRGLDVTYARNITDIDDKIIKRAQERSRTWNEVATEFTESFREDMAALNVLPPTHEPRATDHIAEMHDLIRRLLDRGVAYVVDGDVYFSIEKFAPYGRLSGHDIGNLRAGARVDVDPRLTHPGDFALWKASRPGEPSWPSPWGPGRPGWHIECSAMSVRYLGMGFDIHGGGMDLLFPHHENEIAQAEGALDGRFCRIFMHNGFVNVNKEKMSKSLGNFFLIKQVLESYHPEAVRLFLLGTHYRGPIDLQVDLGPDGSIGSLPQVADAQRRLAYHYETMERLDEMGAGPGRGEVPEQIASAIGKFGEDVDRALSDDLNTALPIGYLGDLAKLGNDLVAKGGGIPKDARAAAARSLRASMAEAGGVLGILQAAPSSFCLAERRRRIAALGIVEDEIERRIALRLEARARKDWAGADAIRDELAAMGVELRDQAGSTRWTVR